jgi:hypothetical protein
VLSVLALMCRDRPAHMVDEQASRARRPLVDGGDIPRHAEPSTVTTSA